VTTDRLGKRKLKKKEKRMRRYGVKGMVAILAIALVLGLATSGFSQGKWVFGIKGDVTFVEPFVVGGDWTEKWNDEVDSLNDDLQDYADLLEALGADVTVNTAEKITRGYSVHAYLERRISEKFGIRTSVEYLMGMSSDYGFDATGYWDDWYWDWLDATMEDEVSASALKVALAPRLILPMGNFVLNLGAGPLYCRANASLTDDLELVGDWWGDIGWYTYEATLTGSGFGFYGDIELKIPLDGLTIDVEVGYESTGKIDVEGTATYEEEYLGVPFTDEWDLEGALDFSGPYVALSLEFPF